MSQYLLSFARENLVGKSDAYLALLWCMFKANQEKGRYSDHIKLHLTTAADQLLGMNYQRMAARFKRVLDARPELNWVAPSGLRPLAYLQVKNFRGFGELGSDDRGTYLRFSKSKNIFYAPNGGGKSSLCEAIEYATTGHIKEADRRKTNVKQYIARGMGKTSLSVMDVDMSPIARSLTWSSCFIDRNRLQEFSLLGSKDTRSAERDIIATLFGLEDFQDVLSRFVRPESFKLNSFLRQDLATKSAALQIEKEDLLKLRSKLTSKISALNSQVCGNLGLQVDQQNAVRTRFLRLSKLAELKVRKAEKLKLAKFPALVPMRRILRAVGITRRLLQRKTKIESALLQNVAAFNYRAVYEALQAIENAETGDICPACSTPMSIAKENPFEKARRELQTMGALEQLKKAHQRIEERIVHMAAEIATSFTGLEANTRLGIVCDLPVTDLKSGIDNFHTSTDRAGAAMHVLELFTQLLAEELSKVQAYIDACEETYEKVAQSDADVKRLNEQAQNLKKVEEILRELFTEKKIALQNFKEAGKKLSDLTHQSDNLKGNEDKNIRFNSLIQQIQIEYQSLYQDLLSYKLSLENARISGIEVKAAEYYKEINAHDDEHERIDSVLFDKTSESYRIKISNSDGTTHDAFSILSEGHLRVLGLSLLLAMAEKNNFPLIVFDDVVNAIDSDHRSNIINLFFSDPYLRRTQMVVTTHDRLFWERFCIIAERHPQADQHSSCVLSYTNKGIIPINYAGGFQEKIDRALDVYDIRQALVYCRIWFESMVLEYCLDNEISITAHFGKSQLKKNTYLEVSLEKTFAHVEPRIAYDLAHFNLIKKDLVNWSGQNQEHHAFDEGSLNFVHSKTSTEVVNIYNAIRLLECQLFPVKKQNSCRDLIEELNNKITHCAGKIEKLDKAPEEIQQKHKRHLADLKKRAAEVSRELVYIEGCLEKTVLDQTAAPGD